MWLWLADPTNQKTLAFIGGGVSVVVGAADCFGTTAHSSCSKTRRLTKWSAMSWRARLLHMIDAPFTSLAAKSMQLVEQVLPHRRELLVDGHAVKLGGRAFDILMAFIE
jgi:calcineurin-like phosphoesterase family protein